MVAIKVLKSDFDGEVIPPVSKSYSQRVLLIAGLTESCVSIKEWNMSDDEKHALDSINKMGGEIQHEGGFLNIKGNLNSNDSVIDVGESGTLLRLILPLIAGKKMRAKILSSGRLLQRPLDDMFSFLRKFGSIVNIENNMIIIDGSNFRIPEVSFINYEKSSQFLSGILMMQAIFGNSGNFVKINKHVPVSGYVDLTINIIEEFGGKISKLDEEFIIERPIHGIKKNIKLERDFSSASFIISSALINSKNGILIKELNLNSKQPDRAIIDFVNENLERRHNGSIFVQPLQNDSFKEYRIDAKLNPDLVPPMVLLSTVNKKLVNVENSEYLKGKESDRKFWIEKNAEIIGVKHTINRGILSFERGELKESAIFDCASDHRISMMQTIAASLLSKGGTVDCVESISKSYPDFLKDMTVLGLKYFKI
ncbi:3-phosphoshikimate 1-carboxyvinyltransferase [Caldiplasma sukawensis]